MLKEQTILGQTYHGIFHVIARVGNHSHNGVGPNGVVVHVIVVVHAGPHQGALWGLKAIELIIGSVLISEKWETHSLLTYKGRNTLAIRFSP